MFLFFSLIPFQMYVSIANRLNLASPDSTTPTYILAQKFMLGYEVKCYLCYSSCADSVVRRAIRRKLTSRLVP